MTRPIAITADDYGLDPAVNQGILELARAGRLTRVSVMAHRDAVLDGLDALAATGVAIGAHLVFVEELPVSRSRALLPILDGGGRLPSSWRTLFPAILARPAIAGALADEARAQLERLGAIGVRPAFVNSHQHAHLFPPLWIALAQLFEATPGDLRVAAGPLQAAGRQRLLATSSAISWAARPIADRTLLRPWGIDVAGRLDASALEQLFEQIARSPATNGLAELVLHPGHERPALHNRYGHWGYAWQRECDLVLSDGFAQALERHGLALERSDQ